MKFVDLTFNLIDLISRCKMDRFSNCIVKIKQLFDVVSYEYIHITVHMCG